MNIELADFLSSLRTEITRARLESEGKDVLFSVESIDLELEVVAEAKAKVGGGVRFWVVSAEAGGEAAAKNTQKVRISLGVQGPDGQKVLTRDETANLLDEE